MLQALFGTAVIGILDWLLIFCVGATSVLIVGAEKHWRRQHGGK